MDAPQPRIDALSDTELHALSALVEHATAMLNADIARFGEPMSDPNTPEVQALRDALDRRRVFVPQAAAAVGHGHLCNVTRGVLGPCNCGASQDGRA